MSGLRSHWRHSKGTANLVLWCVAVVFGNMSHAAEKTATFSPPLPCLAVILSTSGHAAKGAAHLRCCLSLQLGGD